MIAHTRRRRARAGAVATYDHKAGGIYKGVIVGSSGIITFDLFNTSQTMTATMVLDGQTVTLTSTSTYTSGQPIHATFSGTFNGSPAAIVFSCDAYGGNISVTSTIPGHTGAAILVVKELSTALIKCYQGTISGSSANFSGVFNIIANSTTGAWYALYSVPANGPSPLTTGGTMVGSTISCSSCIGLSASSVSGSVVGDNISGTWNDGNGDTGSWAGQRTL